jgi:putative addiction module killer protein
MNLGRSNCEYLILTFCILQDTLIFGGILEAIQRELVIFLDRAGKAPFEIWLIGLKDVQGRAVIRKRLNRVRLGNLGDAKSVGGGVMELRVDFGPGYRVYFGEDGPRIVVLLCGGDKSSQSKDIENAKSFWAEYLNTKEQSLWQSL